MCVCFLERKNDPDLQIMQVASEKLFSRLMQREDYIDFFETAIAPPPPQPPALSAEAVTEIHLAAVATAIVERLTELTR